MIEMRFNLLVVWILCCLGFSVIDQKVRSFFFELIRKTDVETRQVGYAVYAQVAGNHAQGLNEFRAASKSSDLLIVHFQRTIALVTIATPAINMSYVSHNSLSHKLVGQGYTGHNHASHYQHI